MTDTFIIALLYGSIAVYAGCCAVMAYVVITSRIPDCITVCKTDKAYKSMLMDDNY